MAGSDVEAPGGRPVVLLDTNVVLRFLTGEPPAQASRARHLLDSMPVVLSDLVAAEIVFVLASYYKRDRREIAEALRAVVAKPTVQCDNKQVLLFASDVYELTRLGFADSYLVARATTYGNGKVASFDRGIDKIKGVRVEP